MRVSAPAMVVSGHLRTLSHMPTSLTHAEAPSAPPAPVVSPPNLSNDYIGRRLFDHRRVLLFGEITTALAESVSSQLLALDAVTDDELSPIRLLIHSPGGHVEAGDTLHDVIRSLRSPVDVIGSGWVASAAALIYVAVPRERRFCLPNTRFLLHQPLGGVKGRASEIDREVEQIVRIRSRLHRMFAEATGRDLASIAQDMERDFWMSAEEAVAYGLVGKVVERIG
jgi:ATP-dependent Clp protease, protease subunit